MRCGRKRVRRPDGCRAAAPFFAWHFTTAPHIWRRYNRRHNQGLFLMTVAAAVHAPGPKSPLSRLGSPGQLFAFRRDPTGFLLRMAEQYGDVVEMRFANRHVYLLSSPADIEALLVTQQRKFVKGTALQATRRLLGQGLLTSEGDFHLRQRRLIQPIFHRQRIAGYGQDMVQSAAALSARWADGQVLD